MNIAALYPFEEPFRDLSSRQGRFLEVFKMQKVREVLLVFEPCTSRHIVIYTHNFKS
jgi:hypothetical protein